MKDVLLFFPLEQILSGRQEDQPMPRDKFIQLLDLGKEKLLWPCSELKIAREVVKLDC